MSHLTPTRSVRITRGGSAVNPSVTVGEPVAHDTSWDALVRSLAERLAEALELANFAAFEIVDQINGVVDVVATLADVDQEVARTRVRGALLGSPAMLTEIVPVNLDDEHIESHITGEVTVEKRILARLLVLHGDLVAPVPDPTAGDDTVGEGEGGSADPLPETAVGQVAYTLDTVPRNAKDVVLWIGEADTEDDRRARAQAALEVEQGRAGGRRISVHEAIAGVLDG